MGSRALFAVLTVLALVAMACGTRAPEERFEALISDGRGAGSGGATGGGGSDLSGLGSGSGGTPGTSGGAGGSSSDGGGSSGGGSAGGGAGGGARGSGSDVGSGGGGSAGGVSGRGSGGGGGQQAGQGANRASDVGVTRNSIKVGNIVSLSGPLGANAFGPMYFGAKAYFQYLNEAEGGIHGRTIQFVSCDDAADQGRNQECAQQLVEGEKVFALVANATRAYSAGEYVADNGVPDIMGQPIGNAYWTWPGFFSVRGSEYNQNGTVGYKGKLYGGTVQYRWFIQNLSITNSAVFYYNVPASKQFGRHIADGLRKEGMEVTEFEINPALPNFDAAVAEMESKGIDNIWDAMDVNGNRNLCKAMDRNDFRVKAKVTTSQGMGRGIGQYSSPCRLSIYGKAEAIPYSETSNSEVKLFQDVMKRVYGDRFEENLAQWAWEGWLAGKSFADAVRKMGPAPTRTGLIEHYENLEDYTLGGLLAPIEWTFVNFDQQSTKRECIIVAKWNEEKFDFERVSENAYCAEVPYLAYEPA